MIEQEIFHGRVILYVENFDPEGDKHFQAYEQASERQGNLDIPLDLWKDLILLGLFRSHIPLPPEWSITFLSGVRSLAISKEVYTGQ